MGSKAPQPPPHNNPPQHVSPPPPPKYDGADSHRFMRHVIDAARASVAVNEQPSELPRLEKPFLLFAGFDHPHGGWNDLRDQYATFAEAVTDVHPGWDWWHIVDARTCKIVKESR